jgi:TPR repeat protein
MLKEGRGVTRDVPASVEWLRKAAAQDNREAMIDLAIAMFNGTGTHKDEAAAAKLLKRAAELGNPIAMNRLAKLYAAGRGLPRDNARAIAWNAVAKALGLPDAAFDAQLAKIPAADQEAGRRLAAAWHPGAEKP